MTVKDLKELLEVVDEEIEIRTPEGRETTNICIFKSVNGEEVWVWIE